ncbi:MAG: STAS domain-containing protein [Burkholderiaceae bacterium]|nr:STAS domain-containing protein [Burkholderiaceae bacterium]
MASTLSLPAELTIYTVGELRPQWLAWLGSLASSDASVEATVDAAAVDQIDAAGVQLLAALSHSLLAAQRSLCLVNASPLLMQACEALGLPALRCGGQAMGDPA